MLTSPRHIQYDRGAGRVRFRGSAFPLIRNLLIFGTQYALAVTAAVSGAHAVALWAIGVSGISAGYFLGWSGAFLARLRGAPNADGGFDARPRPPRERLAFARRRG